MGLLLDKQPACRAPACCACLLRAHLAVPAAAALPRRSANTSPPSLIADMLCSALGVVGFSWVASPAATELEAVRALAGSAGLLRVVLWPSRSTQCRRFVWSSSRAGELPTRHSPLHPALAPVLQIVLDWLGQLLRLPPSFLSPQGGTGVIQSTASEATLVALLSAKARAMQGRQEGEALKLCAYCSDQAHSSGAPKCQLAAQSREGAQHTSRLARRLGGIAHGVP